MASRRICILGGSGFIGTALAQRLQQSGDQVIVPTRDASRVQHLSALPGIRCVVANIRNDTALRAVLADCDAVINLVGILHNGQDPGGFEGAHVTLPRSVAAACVAAGVRRLIHMSALNAAVDGPSAYLRSRGRGEAAVWEVARTSALQVTMLRPSVVFGPRDNLTNMFAQLVRYLPVVPLGSATAQFQPVHVDDVARVLAACLDMPETTGQTYPLCGPDVVTLRQLVEMVAAASGKRRVVIPLGPKLSMLQATVLEAMLFFTPDKLITRDNVLSMAQPNVCGCPFPAVFGFQPTSLAASLPAWLGQSAA